MERIPKNDGILPDGKIVFLSRFDSFSAKFSRGLSGDVFMEEIEQIDLILDVTFVPFLGTKKAILGASFLSKETFVEKLVKIIKSFHFC